MDDEIIDWENEEDIMIENICHDIEKKYEDLIIY